MCRGQQQEATYAKLWNENAAAFNRYQLFPASNYSVRHYQSTSRKLQAYAAKYGPFVLTFAEAH